MTRIARRYIVHGRVQGVGYRHFAWKSALGAGVCGSVFNRSDGTVEVVAEGTEEQLESFGAALREGPAFARVEDVWTEPLSPRGLRTFEIR